MATERMKLDREPEAGDLRVWHIPQVPMGGFHVYVDSIDEARKVLNVLAEYDLFQFENRIKPDYANAQGLEVCIEVSNDGEENHHCYEWEEWADGQGYFIDEHLDTLDAPPATPPEGE